METPSYDADEPSPRYDTFAKNPTIGKIPYVSFGGQRAKPRAEVYLKTDKNQSAADGKKLEVHGVGVERDGGWGNFGKRGEMQAKLKGYVISKPSNVQPKA